MQIKVISNHEDLQPLAEDWNRAVEASAFDSVFATCEWFSSWGKHFAKGHSLRIVLAYDGGELVGILPVMLERKRYLGSKITIVRSMTNDQSYKYDMILDRLRGLTALKHMMAHMTKHVGWDFMLLDYLPACSESISTLKRLEGESCYRIYTVPFMESPYVRVSGTWSDYLQRLNGSFRRNVNQYERRLERKGAVEVSVLDRTGEDLDAGVQSALAIERLGWKGAAGTAIANSAENTRFYRDLAEAMCHKNQFKLYFLSLNGKKIAFDYCLRYKDRLNMLKTGYDPAYAKDAPGKVLRKKVMERVFQERYAIYDLLGSKEEWKLKWTPDTQKMTRVLVFNKKVLSVVSYHALIAGDRFKEKVRRNPAAHRVMKRIRRSFRREEARG